MFIEILEALFLLSTVVMVAYLVRHYLFTLVALKTAQRKQVNPNFGDATYQPTVSVLIPARNEGRVIGRLLQRMTELTYPKDKLQVIVVDDASKDNTGKIAGKMEKWKNE